MDEELLNLYREMGLDEAQIEELMKMGALGDQQGRLGNQLQRANALRDTPTPEGRRAGRTYVASNPLEHIGAGLQRFQGMKRQQDIESQQQGIGKELAGLRAMMFKRMYGGGGPAAPEGPQAVFAPGQY